MFNYKIRTQLIAIIEFGWSVFALIWILQFIPEYLHFTTHPTARIVKWLTLGSFALAIATSLLQLVSSVLLSLASIHFESSAEDLSVKLRYIEGWESLACYRILLLLPSMFPPPSTLLTHFVLLKPFELFLTIACFRQVSEYRVELHKTLVTMTSGQDEITRISLWRGRQPTTTRRDVENPAEPTEVNVPSPPPPPYEGGGGGVGVAGTSPPPYEQPPSYDDVTTTSESANQEKLPQTETALSTYK